VGLGEHLLCDEGLETSGLGVRGEGGSRSCPETPDPQEGSLGPHCPITESLSGGSPDVGRGPVPMPAVAGAVGSPARPATHPPPPHWEPGQWSAMTFPLQFPTQGVGFYLDRVFFGGAGSGLLFGHGLNKGTGALLGGCGGLSLC